MAQLCKMERSMVIKAPADQMHEIWSSGLHKLSTISPDKVKRIDLLEGQWGKEGCVLLSNFIRAEGRAAFNKEVLEVIDKKNKVVVSKSIGGAPLEMCKSFTWTYQGTPNGNSVRWTVQYEKENADDPEPNVFLDVLMDLTRACDAYLTKA